MTNDPSANAVAGDAEWLLTDGRGGYACGTASDLATRRYHGLWVVRPAGTARRRMAVAGLDERVVLAGQQPEQGTGLLHAHWRGQDRPWAPRVAVRSACRVGPPRAAVPRRSGDG